MIAALFAFALSGALPAALAADANLPHEHQGKAAPYTTPPAVSFTEAELTTLASGKQVLKQGQVGNGGRGVAVMDVRASSDTVWSKILAFGSYPRWVDQVETCEVYKQDGSKVYVRFVLDVMGIGVEYFIKHTVNRSAGYVTWTLDYSRLSDLDDSVGYWRVTPLSTDPPLTRIEYSVDIRFKGWIPGFVQSMIAESGLTSATSWVKKQSEAG